jgi:hypothetical protein
MPSLQNKKSKKSHSSRNAYSLTRSRKTPNSTHRKTCKNISVKMDKIRAHVIKETKQFSKNINEEVSSIKDSFIRKMKKYKKKLESIQKEYLETCSNIDINDFEDVHHNSADDFTKEERETFVKYFTTEDIKHLFI